MVVVVVVVVVDSNRAARPKAVSLPPSQGQAPLVGVRTGRAAPDPSRANESDGHDHCPKGQRMHNRALSEPRSDHASN